ncbi:ferredoxin [Streptomyces sp. NPDC102462]|uniref:ferredoxin n=1 Tax=Streptomyces sp. NPDC102462 TaxID=3366178 RepID=UPI00382C5902
MSETARTRAPGATTATSGTGDPKGARDRTKGPRVEVDRGRCVGSGMCLAHVPAVFDQSDRDGRVLLVEPLPRAGVVPAVRAAAERCPSGAITLHEPGRPGQDLEEE